MEKLIQIIYISRSTFVPLKASEGIEPNVGRILAKSRSNNRKNGLVGVLYFGDECFFQCLEGNEETVDALYATLLQDPRHTDLKLISRKDIAQRSFTEWAMKYVPLEKPMTALLQRHGYQRFDPYVFSDEMTEAVLAVLHAGDDATEMVAPAPQPKTEASVLLPSQQTRFLSRPAIVWGVVALAGAMSAILLLLNK